jgi:hypothetical protein
VWAVRYSTERRSRTLFITAEADAIKQLHPDNPRLARLRDEDRVIVSEPLADEMRPFEPRYEPAAGNGAAERAMSSA